MRSNRTRIRNTGSKAPAKALVGEYVHHAVTPTAKGVIAAALGPNRVQVHLDNGTTEVWYSTFCVIDTAGSGL